MTLLRRLDVRLFASYALVAIVGGLTFILTVQLVAPPLFDDHVHAMSHGPGGMGITDDAFSSTLNTALPLAFLASLITAAVVAAVMARRILQPVGAVQKATRRLAAGGYDERLPIPKETELATLAEDVNSLALTLQNAERRRAELISEVAHELRTPLSTIEGYMEGMIDGIFEPSNQVYVAVTEEVARLQRLAADLSSLSKLDERGFDLERESVDLADLAKRVAERLRPQFDNEHVALDVASHPPITVTVDPERIGQILTNLLGNALTYTPAGGRVTLTTHVEPNAALVTIADTGIGLAPNELEHAFDRFYRAPNVERPPGGSGIGLTIARSIARAHGGDITATSPGSGQGAVFTLRLPR